MVESTVKVKTWSFNETRQFRQWLRNLRNKKIRIVDVKSTNDITTTITYEVLDE